MHDGIARLGSRSRLAHVVLEDSEGCWVVVLDGDERDHVTLGDERDEEVDGDVRDAGKELVDRDFSGFPTCARRKGVPSHSQIVAPVMVIDHSSCT